MCVLVIYQAHATAPSATPRRLVAAQSTALPGAVLMRQWLPTHDARLRGCMSAWWVHAPNPAMWL